MNRVKEASPARPSVGLDRLPAAADTAVTPCNVRWVQPEPGPHGLRTFAITRALEVAVVPRMAAAAHLHAKQMPGFKKPYMLHSLPAEARSGQG